MRRELKQEPFISRNVVSGAGYEWIKGKDGEPRLVIKNTPGTALFVKDLPPALFRQFAALEPTRQNIEDFAKQYGDIFNFWRDTKRADGSLIWGTPLRVWKEEIGDMRILVALWDHIQNRHTAELKKIITLTEEGPWYGIVTPKGRTSASLQYESTPSSANEPIHFTKIQFDPRDVVLPARCALRLEINKRLSEHSTTALLTWTPDTKEASGGYYQRLMFKPSNLLASIWLQFAQAVTGELEVRQCVCGCGRYFQVGPGAGRADKTHYDDVCRAKMGEIRKKDAKKSARKSLR